jgi:hypothetical protein
VRYRVRTEFLSDFAGQFIWCRSIMLLHGKNFDIAAPGLD